MGTFCVLPLSCLKKINKWYLTDVSQIWYWGIIILQLIYFYISPMQPPLYMNMKSIFNLISFLKKKSTNMHNECAKESVFWKNKQLSILSHSQPLKAIIFCLSSYGCYVLFFQDFYNLWKSKVQLIKMLLLLLKQKNIESFVLPNTK